MHFVGACIVACSVRGGRMLVGKLARCLMTILAIGQTLLVCRFGPSSTVLTSLLVDSSAVFRSQPPVSSKSFSNVEAMGPSNSSANRSHLLVEHRKGEKFSSESPPFGVLHSAPISMCSMIGSDLRGIPALVDSSNLARTYPHFKVNDTCTAS